MATLKSIITFFNKGKLIKAGDILTNDLVKESQLISGEHFEVENTNDVKDSSILGKKTETEKVKV
jgi:hypothetical protein